MSGVTINTASDEALKRAEALGRGKYLVTERLALTRDGRVVREDQCTDGGSLLYRAGDEIPLEEARARGIAAEEMAPSSAEPAPTKQAEPAEDKAVTKREVEDKGARRKGK